MEDKQDQKLVREISNIIMDHAKDDHKSFDELTKTLSDFRMEMRENHLKFDNRLVSIEAQVIKTNGRVNGLESRETAQKDVVFKWLLRSVLVAVGAIALAVLQKTGVIDLNPENKQLQELTKHLEDLNYETIK